MSVDTGMTAAMSRIQQIQSTLETLAPRAATGSGSFDDTLSQALGADSGTSRIGDPAPAVASSSASIPGGADPPATSGRDVVSDARRYLGVPYVWGGTNPATGLDCSGLVKKVFGDLGVSMPRHSSDQARTGTRVKDLASARPGDLLAFGSPVHHVAIYVGDGRMIEAPHPGASVRVSDVDETPTAIRRVVGAAPSVGSTAQRLAALTPLFAAAEARYQLPSGVLAAVARTESSLRTDAVSSAGAQGLMQIMPGTAKALGVDPFDPAQAIDGAARLLKDGLAAFHSLPLALAAYNAGGGAVRRYGGIPPYPETQAYVDHVVGLMDGTSS